MVAELRVWVAVMALAAAGCGPRETTSRISRADPRGIETAVVGCLVPAGSAERSVGTSGHSGTSVPSTDAFTLIDTTSTANPYGTAGTSGSTNRTNRSFALIDADEDDLQRYVNSRVEVRGMLIVPAGGASADVRHLQVTSMRQLVSTCQQ